MKHFLLLIGVFILSITHVSSAEVVKAEGFNWGEGCLGIPKGNLRPTINITSNTVHLKMPSFLAQAQKTDRIVNTYCSLQISVIIPNGLRIRFPRLMLRYTMGVPAGGKSIINLIGRINSQGTNLASFNYLKNHGNSQNFISSNIKKAILNPLASYRSRCSNGNEIVRLRYSIRMRSVANRRGNVSFIGMNRSISGLQQRFFLEPCNI